MRCPVFVAAILLVYAFAYGQDVVLKHERLKGHIEKNHDDTYTLVLKDNLRIQLTSLPQSLVDKQSTPVDLFLTIPDATPSQSVVADSPDERPSLAMLSMAESTRRERLQHSGETVTWTLTDLDLPHSFTGVQMHCTPHPMRLLGPSKAR